jgi:hypothetical protein
MCCAVSVSILQNLQDGSPLNRPVVHRCPLTGACPVRKATAWYGLNIIRSLSACILSNFLPPVTQTWQLYQFLRFKWYLFVVCELGNFKAPGTVGQVAVF